MKSSPKRMPERSRGWISGLLAAAVLIGCEEGPTSPGDSLWEGTEGFAATMEVEAAWELTLRDLDPEPRAYAALVDAQNLLERAIELAGPDPRPDVAEALREAQDHCSAAESALAVGEWIVAYSEAKVCWRIANRVVSFLSGGGIRETGLEERAQEVVSHAAALYDKATDLAGENPEEKVARTLEEAHELLEAARAALGAGDFREAIRLGVKSAAYSNRIILYLSDDRLAGEDEVRILPYPFPMETQ